MIPRLVGIAGYAGSGKDTAADVLVELGWQRVAFAGALKDLAGRIGWDGRKDEPGRRLLQDLGVAARDILGADVWVNALMGSLPERAVVTDVRFPNEVAAIHDHGGLVVRVVRTGVVPANDHVSEIALDGVDMPTIWNDGPVHQLHARLLQVLERCPATP